MREREEERVGERDCEHDRDTAYACVMDFMGGRETVETATRRWQSAQILPEQQAAVWTGVRGGERGREEEERDSSQVVHTLWQ